MPAPTLELKVHGRILEHLGIQTYQSPVNAIAEFIANAWDADAETVDIDLPSSVQEEGAKIIIRDDGSGMTAEECQARYLRVGWNRRGDDPDEQSPSGRPILGRKGIGKFAGFGIARLMTIDTISAATGERTVFELDFDELVGEEYIGEGARTVKVLDYEESDEARKANHGTTVVLSSLELARTPSPEPFRKSMARRFLLHQSQEGFRVRVNGEDLPSSRTLEGVQFAFPRDYREDEKPEGLSQINEDGWGIEDVGGEQIRWRFLFHKSTIDEEELRGIAVFSKGKLSQAPFLFQLTGGLAGQHGVEYLSGQVEASFLDLISEDLIATERQRVNWDHEKALPLLEWGQDRVKQLLRIWRDRRSEERNRQLEEKLLRFSERLERLQGHEKKAITAVLRKIGSLATINDEQFVGLGEALLTAYERGRLRDIMEAIASEDEVTEEQLLQILIEANVLQALNLAEVIRTKISTVEGLASIVETRELESELRDYIAQHPWLISTEWETFRIERGIAGIVDEAAEEAGLDTEEDWRGRVDLVLSSGDQLLVLEFMRPGRTIDWDHVNRFERYVRILRTKLAGVTGVSFNRVSGYVVADNINRRPEVVDKLQQLKLENLYALDWKTLLDQAKADLNEFMEILSTREVDDPRLQELTRDDG